MQRLEPDDKSLVNNFACKVLQTISTTPEGQAEEAIPAAMLCARDAKVGVVDVGVRVSSHLEEELTWAIDKWLLGY